MFFLIKTHWENLNRKIWGSLEESVAAPYDMYIELLRYLNDKHGFEASWEELNNPELARKKFHEFPNPQDEATCIGILEAFYEILSQFSTEIAQKYYSKLCQYMEWHNLRYKLTTQCKFRLSLPGLLSTQYTHLQKSISERTERNECLQELENALSKISDADEEKNCIRIASNLLEGLIIDRANRSGITLADALNLCNDLFPHNSLKECVKNIYKFSCDYPNIRHPGTPSNRIRLLKKDDALLVVALTLGLSSFISNNDASGSILSGNL